jgi:phthiocerol/phenolphthiocerol synthesis type-I polyketide synthase E
MSKQKNADLNNAIAITGMACKFPGAVTLQEFWDNLCQGKETITFFTKEELLAAGATSARLDDPNFVRARGVYKNPLAFDARFFGYTPRDAELLDPQQRIFLECCWEALETAGYDSARYPGRIGVFAGTGITHYMFDMMINPAYRNATGFNIVTSSDRDYVATRVGYKLNFRGPCVTVQTACSTSLVATALGCQSLLTYQTDCILAGGVSVDPKEVGGYDYMEGGIMSPDGHCRSFDAAAKGTIFSSGAGVVVLKRLEDATADNDHIYAIIRGFGLNNDGGLRAGFTAPGMDGQTAVTTEALAMSGVNPETMSYIECHGTATALGDPIEIKALSQAFGAFTKKKGFCAVGSVKSNIGHTDSAAGVAGLIKTALALHHRVIPPSIHYQAANPEIHFEETPFYVNATLREWESDGPLRAGVNSFGIGGTNAHVILEEAPKRPPTSISRPWQLLLWSARTSTALDEMTARLKNYLEQEPTVPLADVAYTFQVGRRNFDHRRFLVCRDRESAIHSLAPNAAGPLTFQQNGAAPKIVFLFPGQGAQHINMARELYASEETFRKVFDECVDLFRNQLNQDLKSLIYPEGEAAESSSEKLQQTLFTQPALFTIEYALARQWEKWGIKPTAMIGHSIGEYVAACLAGVMSLQDATALVSVRATLMQAMPTGSMLSVLLPASEVAALLELEPGVSLAAVNGPSACAVSGPSERIATFIQKLTEKKIPHRQLKTSHAFHSTMMDPILPEFLQAVKKVKLLPPQVSYLSNLTGTWIRPEEATNPEYWVQHLRQPVQFSGDLSEVLRSEQRLVFLEVGPGRALSALVTQQAGREANIQVVASLPSVTQEGGDGLASMLNTLGQIWSAGIDPDWQGFYSKEQRRKVPTITYPFEKENFGSFGTMAKAQASSAKAQPSERRAFENWFFSVNWARTPAAAPTPVPDEQQWMVFAGSAGLAKAISEALSQRGGKVVIVTAGSEFSSQENGNFTIRPDAEADYELLMTALVQSKRVPDHVIHALGVLKEHEEDGIGHAVAVLDQSFYSPLYLVKSVGRYLGKKTVRVSFVSSQAFDVVGTEHICPALASVFGPATSAAKEMKNITTKMIDLNASDDGRIAHDDLQLLANECCHSPGNAQAVAFRGGHRWERSYDPTIPPVAESERKLREKGVYLITGGLGGIGLASARFLAQEVKAKLALVGRTAIPARQDWSQFLEHAPADDSVAEKIRAVIALEKLGAEVLVCEADVASMEEMERCIVQVRERFGRIDGAIHAAGIASEGIIELKQRPGAEAVLRPKVQGCLILDQLLQDEDLDFFILCSSLVGVLGSAGQVDYSAGNAFLDAFAWSKRKARKNRPVSINWDRWDDVGMAAKQIREVAARQSRLVEGTEEHLSHPIFTRRIIGRDHKTYAFLLSAKTHWVAGEHKIMGLPTMVGTSHLEYVRAAYQHSEGMDRVEIRDLIFIQPVMLREGEERDVYYALKAARNGNHEFTVWSIDHGTRMEHARGRISAVADGPTKSHDAQQIFSRCGNARKAVLSEGVSTNGDAAVVQLSQRWAIFERIADSEQEAIAEMRLSAIHLDDLSTFLMHPAVLDCATSYASGPIARQMYLPLAYQKVRVLKAMSPVMYSYKRFKAIESGIAEVVSCDVVLFDESGQPVIEIEGFTMKRVADPEALSARVKAGSNGHKSAAVQERPRAHYAPRISPDDGVEVLHRVMTSPWVPQVIVNVGEANEEVTIDQTTTGSGESGTSTGDGEKKYARPALGTPYIAPRSELESGIAEIWQSVLGIDKIGVQDDFLDLGGHSLLAIQLTSRISETYGIDFPISGFYEQPTIEGLAQSILVKLTEGLQDSSLEELLEEGSQPSAA